MGASENGEVHVLQQFTTVAGRKWYALQKQTDGGVAWQWTGYRYEIEELVSILGIVPEEHEPITEEEFFLVLEN